MKKIAITGNIASGKSLVGEMLQRKGYKVYDSDKLAHEILYESSAIKDFFAPYDVWENGKLSRLKLGNLVFANEVLKLKLESIIHPLVKKKIEEIFEKNKTEKYVFVGIPLLFEAKMQDMFDKVVLIYCNDAIRLERLMNRNNLSKQQALLRLKSQMSQDCKIELVDYVIKNETSQMDLEIQIDNIFEG